MSLLDNTKIQIKNIAKTLLRPIKILLHPTNISYGFIGLTTAILGYYTFFENNIEKPLPDTLASPSESNASPSESTASSPASSQESTASSLNPFASSPESTASSPSESIASSLNPFASSNPSDEKPIISGGKKYKTKKITKKKK